MTDAHSGEPEDRDLVAELQRWQDTGAVWQVVLRSRRGVTVALLRCDGDEEVDRFCSDDPRLLAIMGDRLDSAG